MPNMNGSTITEYNPVNYALQVRRNGQVFVYCGSFMPSDSDSGSAGSGRTVATFTLP